MHLSFFFFPHDFLFLLLFRKINYLLVRLPCMLSSPGKGQDYWGEENINEEMPACQQMFNIFHPFDPVAYRSALFPS